MAQFPHCHAEMEDKTHILWCPAASARAQWSLSMPKLSQWMKDQGTATKVQTAIMSQLESWVCKEPLQANMEDPQIICNVKKSKASTKSAVPIPVATSFSTYATSR